MGRFVNSISEQVSYEYRFVVAEQDSNFGEVLSEAGLEYLSTQRFIGDNGEYCELFFDNVSKAKEELENLSKQLIEDKNINESEMIKQLVYEIPDSLPDCSTVKFFVEY
jgi:hypothetical protein